MAKAKTEVIVSDIEPLLIGSDEAARLLGIGHALFFKMKADGRLGLLPISFGRKRLYDVKELRAWIHNGCPSRQRWQEIKDGK